MIICLGAWSNILFSIFGFTRLYINQENIQIVYEMLGFKYIPSLSSRNDVCKLEIVSTTINTNPMGSLEIPPRLTIWMGKRSYQLGTVILDTKFDELKMYPKILTSPEVDWLAQELSDYLDLPISRDIVSIKNMFHPENTK